MFIRYLIDKINYFKFKLTSIFNQAVLETQNEIARLEDAIVEEQSRAPENKPAKLSKKEKRRQNFEKFRAHKEQEKIWQQKHSQKSIERNHNEGRFREKGLKVKVEKKYTLPFDKNLPRPELTNHALLRFNKRIQKISELEMEKWLTKVWKQLMNENKDPNAEPKVIYAVYKGREQAFIKCGAPETNKVVYLALSKTIDGFLTVLDSRCWYRNIKGERVL
jgi:hypothetical protein